MHGTSPYQFAGNKPIYGVDLDGLEEKIAIIIEHEQEFTTVHETELLDAGYVVIHAKSGADALEKIADSQNNTGIPTREMLFLTHGFAGGMVGDEINSGLYSD